MKTAIISFFFTIAMGSILAVPFYMNYQDFAYIRNKQFSSGLSYRMIGKSFERRVEKERAQCEASPGIDACLFTVRYYLAGSPHIKALADYTSQD